MMKEIIADETLVAYCGLYCGACKSFRNDRCLGCHGNEKAKWCKVRVCCTQNGYSSCADCRDFSDIMNCQKFNNFFSKAVGFLMNSDRLACIGQIKTLGIKGHTDLMAMAGRQTIRKRGR